MDPLSVDDFVNRLKGASTTNDWDVVVSYDEKKITDLLEDLWEEKKTFGNLKLNVPVTRDIFVINRPRSVTLNVHFDLTFSNPRLQFHPTQSGRAILSLILGGNHQAENSDTTYGLPKGYYQLDVNVPIAAMNEKTPPGEASPAETVVKLSDSDDTKKSYLVLEFGAKGSSTTYTISTIRDLNDTDGKVTLDGVTIDALTEGLATWMSNVDNVSKIKFALAMVDASVGDKATKMQPQSFVFTSTAGKDKSGFLSVYIQCKDSNNGPGASKPVFKPGQIDTLPVPSGYTSSIIISNRFFINSYLIPQLKASGANEVNNKGATDGITLEVKFDQKVIKRVDTDTYFSADAIEFDFQANPITFSISNASFSASWNYQKVLKWDVSGIPGPSGFRVGGSWGKVELTINMKKDSQTIKTSNHSLNISGKVSNNDFKISTKAQRLDFLDLWSGGTNDLLKALESNNLKLDIKDLSFECNDIDFFATSNIFAPGKTMIDVDVTNGLKTPFDIVILGNVHPQVDTTPHAAMIALAMARPLASAEESILADKLAQYARFMNQIATAQPVATDFYRALATGSESAVRDALAVYKYDLDTLLEVCEHPGIAPPTQLSALEKAFPPQRGNFRRMFAADVPITYFDLRVYAGIYDTKCGDETGYLKVDPATLQISVGTKVDNTDPQKSVNWTKVDHSVSGGEVSWSSDGKDVKITFSRDYSVEDGSPLPSTFCGTKDSVKYKGVQIVAKSDDPDWTSQHPALVTSFIATIAGTVFGLGIPFAQWAFPILKKKFNDRAQKKIDDASSAASSIASTMGDSPEDIEMANLEVASHDSVTREFSSIWNNDASRASLRTNQGVLSDADLDYISKSAAQEIRREVHSMVDTAIRQSFAALRPFMTAKDEATCVDTIFNIHVEPKITECTDPAKLKPYVQEEVKVSYIDAELTQLANDKVQLQNQYDKLDKSITTTEKTITQLQDDKKEADKKSAAATTEADKALHDQESKDAADKIKDLMDSETYKQEKQDRKDASDDINSNDADRATLEHDKSDAETKRDAEKHNVFKDPGHAHGV